MSRSNDERRSTLKDGRHASVTDHHRHHGSMQKANYRSSTAPNRSPGELFAFSQKTRRKGSDDDESDLDYNPHHTTTGSFLNQAETFHEQVIHKQMRRELRVAQFERNKLIIEEEVDMSRDALVEKIDTNERRQLQFQRQLAAANQSKAFAAQQQRNEQQKLRRELLQLKASQQIKAQQKKWATFSGENVAEVEDDDSKPDVCRSLLASHMERNKELEHARQFVRNNERLNDAYWHKLLPEGRMEAMGKIDSKNRMTRKLMHASTDSPRALESKNRKAAYQSRATKVTSSTSLGLQRLNSAPTVPAFERQESDEEERDQMSKWDAYWSRWETVNNRWRDQMENDYKVGWHRRTVLHHKLDERRDKKQQHLDARSNAVADAHGHRKSRAFKKKQSINAIHQAALEETQERLAAIVEKNQRKQAQKIIDQENSRRERAALGKEAMMAAEKLAIATEYERRTRQAEKEAQVGEQTQKKLEHLKERAAVTAARHQTRTECAKDRKEAALTSFQFHARAGFDKMEDRFLQRQGTSSSDGGLSANYKRRKEPASAELLALIGSHAAEITRNSVSAEGVDVATDSRAFADRIRVELSRHLRIVGMTLKHVWKMMDLNGNGLVSMSEFQSGLKDVTFDPVLYKLGSPRACFAAFGGGAGQLTPAMFLGRSEHEPVSPKPSPLDKGRSVSDEEMLEEDDGVSSRHKAKRGAVAHESNMKPEEESEEEADEGEGDEEPTTAPWAATEEDFVLAVETSLKAKSKSTSGSSTDPPELLALPGSGVPLALPGASK